jgi:uncharacterized lipoprotein YehR (DUF1307 family)
MKKNKLYIISICCVFIFTSCFDILEDVTFNKDYSGEFNFIFQFKNAQILQQQANTEMSNTVQDLKMVNNIDGIKNFEYVIDKSQNQFGIKFNFNNIDNLNHALQIIFKTNDVKYFAVKNNTIIRYEYNNITERIEENFGEQKKLFDFNVLFDDVKYNTQYHFYNNVDSTQNKNTIISENNTSNTMYLFNKEKNKENQTLADTIFIKI